MSILFVRDCLRLIRPAEWIKNVLVLLPAILAEGVQRIDGESLAALGAAFAGFCVLSSVVYILNDIFDRHADAQHPDKAHRPLACGAISVPSATILSLILGCAGLFLLLQVGSAILIFGLCYLGLNIAYSMGIKSVPVVELLIVASGFPLRLATGSAALEEAASITALACVFGGALFVVIEKRRAELNSNGNDSRAVLKRYSPRALTIASITAVAGSIFALALFSQSSEASLYYGTELVFTIPVLLLGAARYAFLSNRGSDKRSPVKLMTRDPWILACAGLLIYFLGFFK